VLEALLKGTHISVLQSAWTVERVLAHGTRMNSFGLSARRFTGGRDPVLWGGHLIGEIAIAWPG
jgi:hypothetical protein